MCVCMYPSGPEGTCFDGGVFVTELIFPTDYPLSPPKMRFISDIFHPNGKNHTLPNIRTIPHHTNIPVSSL